MLYVLMQKRSTHGFPAVFMPYGVVESESVAFSQTEGHSDRYFVEFDQLSPGKWMKQVRRSVATVEVDDTALD